MAKINSFIDTYIFKIIILFLLFSPVIDAVTSVMINYANISLTLGMLARMIFMGLSIYYILFVSRNKYQKYNIIYLSLIMIYGILFSLNNDINKLEIIYLIKTFYFPILFIFFLNLFYNKKDIVHHSYLIRTGFIYLVLIIIPNILNIGINSYDITKEGSVGLFNSANEVSAILAVLIPLILNYILKLKNIIFKSLLYGALFYACTSIGTKVPIIALLLTTFIYFIIYIFSIKNRVKVISIITAFIMCIIAIILVIPKTSFYKNLVVHYEFLEIDNVTEIITNPKYLDHFIFSSRIKFMSDVKKIYNNTDTITKFIGMGHIVDGNEFKTIEMDYYDVFYEYGIIGFILYFVVFVIILTNIFKDNIKKIFILDNLPYILSLFLILLLGMFQGRIYVSPSVSVFTAIISVSIFYKLNGINCKKKILFTNYSFNQGGVEKSFITLLKNIDYDSYDVTVMVLSNEGVYKEEVPTNVKIIEYKDNIFNYLLLLIKSYYMFDVGMCYEPKSLTCSKLVHILSPNTILYIHNNYRYLYGDDIEKIRKFFDARKINKYNKIIFVSNESKKDLSRIYPSIKKKSLVINSLVDEDDILVKSNEKIALRKSKRPLFVFVGRLDEKNKKISRLINVVKDLDNVDLWIIGDGKDSYMYEKLIYKCKSIKLLGNIDNPYPYIKKANYIVLTSDYEAFPVIYNEAIVLNKKIITTVDVSDDVIRIPSNFGYIVSKDEVKMAKEITKILATDNMECKKLDFKKINEKRIKKLENIF